MTYLSSLARPAAATQAAAPFPVHESVREPFGDEHPEIELGAPIAAPPDDSPIERSALVPPATPGDRSVALDPRPMPSVAAAAQAAPASPRSRPGGIQEALPTAAAARPEAPPVVMVRREPENPSRSSASKRLPARGGAIVSDPDAPAPAQPSVSLVPRTSTAPLRQGQASLRTESTTARPAERDEPASASPRSRVSPRATVLSVASTENTDKASRSAAGPSRPERRAVQLHIGAIALTVKAPATAAAAVAPAVPVAAPPPAAAATPRSRDGLGFSASRHYLRWS